MRYWPHPTAFPRRQYETGRMGDSTPRLVAFDGNRGGGLLYHRPLGPPLTPASEQDA